MGGEFEFPSKYHTTISYGTPVELHRRLTRNETETATCIHDYIQHKRQANASLLLHSNNCLPTDHFAIGCPCFKNWTIQVRQLKLDSIGTITLSHIWTHTSRRVRMPFASRRRIIYISRMAILDGGVRIISLEITCI